MEWGIAGRTGWKPVPMETIGRRPVPRFPLIDGQDTGGTGRRSLMAAAVRL